MNLKKEILFFLIIIFGISLFAQSSYLLSKQKFDDEQNVKIQSINLGLGIAFRL
jgi:hypothetical protein